MTRYDARTRTARSVSPWMHTLDSEPTKVKYRCHWTPPLAVDPFDDETVYYGCQVIFKTSDRGQTWQVISPDLSTGDPQRIVSSGGVVGDNLGQFYGEVVFAIAPSPIQKGLMWAGTNDGKVWYTQNGGGNWTDVTSNLTGAPPWGTVTKIEPSSFDPAIAYVVLDYHLMDRRDPYIYRTTDFGRTWTRISDALPHGHPLAYAISVAENPNRRDMLFAGTGNGFFYSRDAGRSWTALQDGLPRAPVTWITVQKAYHDVVVSTYGRGLYVLGDITRLEQADKAGSGTTVLYTPRTGFRLSRTGSADLIFALGAAPREPVRFEILDSKGTIVRTISTSAREGTNWLTWDLRYDGPRVVELRTTPPDNPHIWEEARFKGRDTRPILHWGIEQPQRTGPIAAPGTYSVRMTVDGQTVMQPLQIMKDPAIASSDEDLAASTALQVRLRDDLNQAVDIINALERVGKQVEDQTRAKPSPAVATALADLDKKRTNVLLQLLSRAELHSDDKWYVEAYKIYLNLIWQSGVVGTGAGDVAGGADSRPTQAAMQVTADIERDLAKARADFDRFIQTDLPAFNKSMNGKVPPLTVSAGSKP